MNANEMTFGIEIETVMPAGTVNAGGYHCGLQIPGLPRGWNAQRDGSLSPPPGYAGVEVVSPVLKGAAGLEQIKTVCEWLANVGAKVNRSTGLHVHIGWTSPNNGPALKRLACDVANFQKALFASTGTHSREAGGFCKSVRDDYGMQEKFQRGNERVRMISDRFMTLNVTNLGSSKNTVEFRCFAGTTNLTKILGYVRLCLGIVERAVNAKRPSRWNGVPVNATRKPYAGHGPGTIEILRLFFALGWLKGDSKVVLGDVQSPGLPTIEDCKAELMRLGAKYDGRVETSAPTSDDAENN